MTGVTVGLSRLHHPVTSLGPGRRAGVWFQGCGIGCTGCVATDTWAPAPEGERVPLRSVTDWLATLPADEVDGVTISGGEPFEQPEALAALTAWVRRNLGADGRELDVLVYSGYTEAVVRRRHADVLGDIDVLVTGPYRPSAVEPRRWRGSANQRMVVLTHLGWRRYGDHVGAPADTPLQVTSDDGRLYFIGVPRRGELARLERTLAERGIHLEDRSWTA